MRLKNVQINFFHKKEKGGNLRLQPWNLDVEQLRKELYRTQRQWHLTLKPLQS